MGHHTCCNKQKVKRGLWSPEEDDKLINYITTNGHGCWSSVPRLAGLQRCGKSCRLRWINYLRPDLKRGNFSPQEAALIIDLHRILGNRWSQIAKYLPGRTDNEVKNFWNSRIKKKLLSQAFVVANNTTTTPNLISNDLHLNYYPNNNTSSNIITHDHHNNVGAFTTLFPSLNNNSIISPNLILTPPQVSHNNHHQISHNDLINHPNEVTTRVIHGFDQPNELILTQLTPHNLVPPISVNSYEYDPSLSSLGFQHLLLNEAGLLLNNQYEDHHQFFTQDHHQQESYDDDQTIMRTKLMVGVPVMPKLETMTMLEGLLEVCSMPSSSFSHHQDNIHDVHKSFPVSSSSCMLDQQMEYYNYANDIDDKNYHVIPSAPSSSSSSPPSPPQASPSSSSFMATKTTALPCGGTQVVMNPSILSCWNA